jgi:hypothetical protein
MSNGQVKPTGSSKHRLDLAKWLQTRGIEFRQKPNESKGRTVYVLASCPFNPDHGADSCIMQGPDGKLSARCLHNSCSANGWEEFKQKIGVPDPGHYDPPLPEAAQSNPSHEETQAKQLINLALKTGVELFHDCNKDAYATVPVGEHLETFKLRTKPFHLWLRRLFYCNSDKPPGAQAVQDALGELEARAIFDHPEYKVWVRLAEYDGKIYVDLGNDKWNAVEVDTEGWRIINRPPVRFRRAKAMLALPEPVRGGSLRELRSFVNVSDRDWPLLLAWLVSTARPSGPFAVLFLFGEQGSAKTTTAMLLRSLIDPNTANTRAGPRDTRDLAIAANNAWIASLNNVSYLPEWLSDALCRLNSGEGFSTRTLYENEDETIFSVARPILLNGIGEIITRPDLLDRTISLCCLPIAETKRRDEQDFRREFEKVKAGIIGALFDAVAEGLRNLPSVKVDRLPRLADFTKWAMACEAALGLEKDGFIKAYRRNIRDANELALEASPIAAPLLEFVRTREGEWIGTASQLLEALTSCLAEQRANSKDWPKNGHALSTRLRRLVPNLRKIGVQIEFKHGKQRIISILKNSNAKPRRLRRLRREHEKTREI